MENLLDCYPCGTEARNFACLACLKSQLVSLQLKIDLGFFFFLMGWHLNLPYVGKTIHLGLGAVSNWHYMLFAKRTAIIEIIFAARVNRPPFPSLSAAVGPPPFPLSCIYLAFRVPPLILIFLLPHSIPIAVVTSCFLFLCFLVTFLFLQHFYVIFLSFLLFLCPVIVSFSLSALSPPPPIHTKKFPLSEVWEVREEAWFPESTQITSREHSLWII